jgi:hypothetical protein
MPPTMQQVLKEAEQAAEGAKWEVSAALETAVNPGGARAYETVHNGWKFVVVSFNIEDQGFPPGSLGYDGAATNKEKGVVLHLTRELAEKFYKAAAL